MCLFWICKFSLYLKYANFLFFLFFSLFRFAVNCSDYANSLSFFFIPILSYDFDYINYSSNLSNLFFCSGNFGNANFARPPPLCQFLCQYVHGFEQIHFSDILELELKFSIQSQTSFILPL